MARFLIKLFTISVFISFVLSVPISEKSEKNEKAPLTQDQLKPPVMLSEPQKNEKAPLTQDHIKPSVMVPEPQNNEKAPLTQDQLKPPVMVSEPQKNEKAPLMQDHIKPSVMVPEPQKNGKEPLTQEHVKLPIWVPEHPQTTPTPITNPQNDDIEQTEMKEDTDETGESEGQELISDPLLRSNLESLVAPSSSESLDPSEFIKDHQVRDTLDNIVSTSDIFHFPEGPKKYRVVVLPKGKALHFVYKVVVFPKGRFAQPKVFKLVIVPGKITRRGRKVTFIVIPKDAPGSWKQYVIFIPHKN